MPTNIAYLGLLTEDHTHPMESGKGAAVRVVTTSTSLSCTDNSQSVAHISLGCEKGKRLVVNRYFVFQILFYLCFNRLNFEYCISEGHMNVVK